MAGDWIKMRADLGEDPAVITMAARLSVDEFAVVGRLHRFWSWVDRQSRDGQVPGVTHAWLDRYVSCEGFAAALVGVGWLELRDDGLAIPNFDRHNGETAKTRARNTKNQAGRRAVTGMSPDSGDKTATREEKRREEEASSLTGGAGRAEKRSAKEIVESFKAGPDQRRWATQNAPHIDAGSETERWRDHLRANGYRTRAGAIRDAEASWRNWMAREEKWSRERGSAGKPRLAPAPMIVEPTQPVTADDVRGVETELRLGWTRGDATADQARAWVTYCRALPDLSVAEPLAEWIAQKGAVA